jgi:eukaryotic-like serine/threonine-protein kinase
VASDQEERHDAGSDSLSDNDAQVANGIRKMNSAGQHPLGAPSSGGELSDDDSFILLLDKYWPRHRPPEQSCTSHRESDDFALASDSVVTIGRFQIIRELGRGGFGRVYLARDPMLEHDVAIKIPHGATKQSGELQRRFEREARVAASLTHPHINQIYETNKAGDDLYIASYYCQGPTLADWLKHRLAPVSPDSAAGLIMALAGAVQHAHDCGVLHRDLKPSNVLLDRVNQLPAAGTAEATFEGFFPRLCDFGLAKILDEESDDTRSGLVLGTPRYMAPEQAAGMISMIAPHTDIYALGVMLYELLVGRPPFVADTDLETLRQIRSDEPISIRRLQPKVPRDLDIICMKCLEKESERRYVSAADLVADLSRFLSHQPILARPKSPARRARSWARRRPVQATVLLTGVVVLLGLPSALFWHTTRLERAFRVAEQQRIRAQEFEAEARAEKASVQEHAYASDMRLAHELLKQGDLTAVANLVDHHDPERNQAPDRRGFEWWHLRRNSNVGQRAWLAHSGDLTQLAYSADGRILLTASFADQSAKTWELPTGNPLATVPLRKWVDERENQAAAISPNGKLVATLTDKRVVGIWDAVTGDAITRLSDDRPALCVAFSPDGRYLVVGGFDRSKIWKCDEWQAAAATVGPARLAAFSPDGTTLATVEFGAHSHAVDFWDIATQSVKRSVTLYGPILDMAYSRDGRKLGVVVEGLDATSIGVYNPETGEGITSVKLPDTRFRWVSFSADGSLMASAAHDGSFRLWNTSRGEARGSLRGPAGRLSHVVFSPDGRSFATTTTDGRLRLWDQTLLGTPAPVPVPAPASGPLVFAPHSRQLAVADTDCRVMLVNGDTGQVEARLQGHISRVTDIAFSSDAQRLATVDGCHVRCWHASDGRQLWSIPAAGVRTIAWSPVGEVLAAGGKEPRVRLLDAANGAEIALLDGHTDQITSVRFMPDGQHLASASRDQTVRIWDMNTFAAASPPLSHDGSVLELAVSSDGHYLAAAVSSHNLFVWKFSADGPPQRLDLAIPWVADSPSSITFSPDNNAVCAAGLTGVLAVYDLTTRKGRYGLSGRGAHPASAAYSADGQLLAVVSQFNVLSIWDTLTWTGRRVLGAPLAAIRGLAFSADGKTLAVASDDAPGSEPQRYGYSPAPLTVHISSQDPRLKLLKSVDVKRDYAPWQSTADSIRFWDVASGTERPPLLPFEPSITMMPSLAWSHRKNVLVAASHDGAISAWDMTALRSAAHFHFEESPPAPDADANHPRLVPQSAIDRKAPPPLVAFSPDGTRLATADRRGVVKTWDTADWHVVRTLASEHADARCLVFSPDGATLAVNDRGQIKLWNPHEGQLRATIGEPAASAIHCGTFSPDGRLLVIGRGDGSIQFIDVARRSIATTLAGHVNPVASLAFAPDGRTLASGGSDRMVRMWNLASRSQVATLEGHRGPVHALVFSPDGTTLASGGEIADGLGELFLWRAPRDERPRAVRPPGE